MKDLFIRILSGYESTTARSMCWKMTTVPFEAL